MLFGIKVVYFQSEHTGNSFRNSFDKNPQICFYLFPETSVATVGWGHH